MNRLILAICLLMSLDSIGAAQEPDHLTLNPKNPHYLNYRGKPTLLIGSTEHYGAVLNGAFNYITYLDSLKAEGMNLTRTFSGSYREVEGSFKIVDNTLAPSPRQFLCPWKRSSTPGAADGLNKFDLSEWDPAYFKRLKDFVGQAEKRDIIVELSLFCPMYEDSLWAVNPMNERNNINKLGACGSKEIYALNDKALTMHQDALVKKLVAELKDFKNVYYEICNEPYFGGVTAQWNDHVVQVIVDAESSFPINHLIAQNIANGSAKVERPNPHVSIFNFHYAAPPDTVKLNWNLNKVIGDDETGFRGVKDLPYRTEAWDFVLAGGGIYDNLDYSFICKKPDGTSVVTTSPGGGGPALRKQLRVLKDFMGELDLVKMKPDSGVIKLAKATTPSATPTEDKFSTRCLAESGKVYAIYCHGCNGVEMTLDLPPGHYQSRWIDTKTGKGIKIDSIEHKGRELTLTSPQFKDDVALRLVRAKE